MASNPFVDHPKPLEGLDRLTPLAQSGIFKSQREAHWGTGVNGKFKSEKQQSLRHHAARAFLLSALLALVPVSRALAFPRSQEVHETHLQPMDSCDGCAKDEYVKDKRWYLLHWCRPSVSGSPQRRQMVQLWCHGGTTQRSGA